MELYLVQHAEAKSREEDPSRPLSDRGRETISRVTGFAKGLGIKVRVIKHSDKLRAEETAQELAKAVTSAEGLQKADGLGPNDDVGQMRTLLAETSDNIMIVGHLPYLSRLTSSLLGVEQEQKAVDFQMGSIVRLDRDEPSGKWHIKWFITPDIIKA